MIERKSELYNSLVRICISQGVPPDNIEQSDEQLWVTYNVKSLAASFNQERYHKFYDAMLSFAKQNNLLDGYMVDKEGFPVIFFQGHK